MLFAHLDFLHFTIVQHWLLILGMVSLAFIIIQSQMFWWIRRKYYVAIKRMARILHGMYVTVRPSTWLFIISFWIIHIVLHTAISFFRLHFYFVQNSMKVISQNKNVFILKICTIPLISHVLCNFLYFTDDLSWHFSKCFSGSLASYEVRNLRYSPI